MLARADGKLTLSAWCELRRTSASSSSTTSTAIGKRTFADEAGKTLADLFHQIGILPPR